MTIDPSPGAVTAVPEEAREGASDTTQLRRDAVRPSPRDRGGPKGRKEAARAGVDWKRVALILLGVGLFAGVYFAPLPGPAVDPQGKAFALTREGKAALALFFLAATWWVTEVIPIGVTAIAIGVVQALFLIRPAREAFTDFMDPSVWFIFGSLMIGMVFTKTGLTRRVAYKMLSVVGERTSMIYLGCFVMTAGLTLIMAHTAVAATVYPLFLAIYALYTEDSTPTRFGKGLFMGMAFVAGAGSIITLLGAARGAVAIGFFYDITGRQIDFFHLTYFMLPVGAVMVALLWLFFMLWYPPEKKTIPGLRDRVNRLYATLGPVSRNEIVALVLVLGTIAVLSLRSFIPALEPLDKSAIILVPIVLLFLLRILTLEDLEGASWNIVFLFGGAMSIGLCLWRTGAAEWLAVKWLGLFTEANWLVFVLGMAAFVLVMTNFIMNVAAIAISMPVALVIAPYLGVAPDVVLFASLVTAGMPFLLLVGAAPNAIAYGSRQFTAKEFFVTGLPASGMLMAVLAVFVWLVWPLMGMPVMAGG
jgi:sodium-dependent dicarboxylate transporter 2/3/5